MKRRGKVLLSIPKGEHAEGMPWSIETGEDVGYEQDFRCPHSFGDGERYSIPLMISASNEGGHNGVDLCVLCVLESLAMLDVPGFEVRQL